MAVIAAQKLVQAIALNQAKRFKVFSLLKPVLGNTDRGGVRWEDKPVEENTSHILGIYKLFYDHIPDLKGKTGIEIGPGDNLGVAYCYVKSGARRIYCIEKFSNIRLNSKAIGILRELDRRLPQFPLGVDQILAPTAEGYRLDDDRLQLNQVLFEDFRVREKIDFIYSNDVLEHVKNPLETFRKAYDLLAPGGIFLNSFDLAGHNAFSNPQRPLDFLTCEDWLWSWMFSHVETSNRVGYSEFLDIAKRVGFKVRLVDAIHKADLAYVRAIKPRMLPRYQRLLDEDLSILQCLLVLEK